MTAGRPRLQACALARQRRLAPNRPRLTRARSLLQRPQDKGSGTSAGYGFVKFSDRRCSMVALQFLNVRRLAAQRLAGGARAGERGGTAARACALKRQHRAHVWSIPPPHTHTQSQGKVLFGQEMRVNWAFQSHQREDTSNHFHVFVGDLGQDVTDAVLYAAFSGMLGCS